MEYVYIWANAGQSGNLNTPDSPATSTRRKGKEKKMENAIIIAETVEAIDNSAIKIALADGTKSLENKKDNVTFALMRAALITEQSSTVYVNRLLEQSGMYTCTEFEEFLKRTNKISATFLSKSVDRINRDIKSGKYKIIELPNETGALVEFYSKIGEAECIAEKSLFDMLAKLCDKLQKRAQRAKKEAKELASKADELVNIIKNEIGKENKGLFHESQKILADTLKKIDEFNNTKAKTVYCRIEINSTWNEYLALQWTNSPEFKTRQKGETERILEEQQKQSMLAAQEKVSIADLVLAWKAYKATINTNAETAKSQAQRKNLERLFQLIK